MGHQVRRAEAGDANDISQVIVRALRETNARDYAPEIIARLERSFTPSAVEQQIERRDVFVGLIDDRIVGTASLEGQVIQTVFVSPDAQGRGVGRLLMQAVEATARERQVAVLHLSSSITAETFYAGLGFRAVRDAFYGDERSIVMERILSPTAS
ncbi:MAG TPA: GNAT family N-acetyltransferase [Tardiphaga sp.]